MAISEKWIQENMIFIIFCYCFKWSKKFEKLSNDQPTHVIAKSTLAKCNRLRNLVGNEI